MDEAPDGSAGPPEPMDEDGATEVSTEDVAGPKAGPVVRAMDKETVHRICSGQVRNVWRFV